MHSEYANGSILAGRGNLQAIGAGGQAMAKQSVAAQGKHLTLTLEVPDLDGFVFPAA